MQGQVTVVLREALHDPEALRVHLALVVKRPKFYRAEPLRVPRVEVLVADGAQPPEVALRRARQRLVIKTVEFLCSRAPLVSVIMLRNR